MSHGDCWWNSSSVPFIRFLTTRFRIGYVSVRVTVVFSHTIRWAGWLADVPTVLLDLPIHSRPQSDLQKPSYVDAICLCKSAELAIV